ncbi:MAG: glycosyltransferase family 2 protein [Bacteroidetes bacterium]|nr:glycosyltransferase family 2 protein [Bacteroidota bacterium]
MIIATYNWPEALELCLLSTTKQSLLPTEIIIADDGSKDDTEKLVKDFQKMTSIPIRHIWQPDEGFQLGKIRNKSMAAAMGEYLIQIDGDLILHPSFVRDHLSVSRKGYFIAGSRVLLDESLSTQLIKKKNTEVSIFASGVHNQFNGVHLPGLAKFIEFFKKEKGLYNLRGCNMSFWKKDIIAVNGYNENIHGWGREDTELVIRLYNTGIKRVYFKLQGIVYHLYHQEYDRSHVLQNDEIVKQAIKTNQTHCEKGIDQYL